MIHSFSVKDRILISIVCAMMFVFGSITSCVSGVTKFFSPKPVVESVDIGQPIVIDEPKPAPLPKPEPKPEPRPQPKPEPKPAGKIVMYTSDYCVWCVRWKSDELQKVKDAGWEVVEIESASGPVPRFEVSSNNKTIKHTGYMSMAALRGIVERLK